MPVPYRLESFEKAVALFTFLNTNAPHNSALHYHMYIFII